MNWRVIVAIAQKDIVDAIKNSYILFALVLPIGLLFLFRLAFGSSDGSLTLAIAVHDPDGSRLVAALRALPNVKLLDVASSEQLPKEVEKSAVGGLAVPVGFDDAVKAGAKPALTVYVNRQHGGGEIAAFQQLIQQQVWALVGQDAPARLNWTNVAAPPGLFSQSGLVFDRYILMVCLVMALVMAGSFVVPTLLVEEKEKHTLEALLVSPARTVEVVAGKALTGLVYSLLSAGVLIALNQGWMGNWSVTALVVMLGAIFAVLAGLLMGALFHTAQQVNTWSSLAMLVLIIPTMTGVIGPPGPVDMALHLIPTYYITQVLSLALAGQATLERVWSDLAILAGTVVVAFAAVVWTLQRGEK